MGGASESVFDIHQADARNLKKELAQRVDSIDGLVDAVITSPPYADMQKYGEQDEQVGEQPYEAFLKDLRLIFKQCYDVASDDSTLWIITDTFRRNNRVVRPPYDIADELENLENRTECLRDECIGRLRRDRGTGYLHCVTCGEELNPLRESWRLNDHLIWNKQRTRPWRKKGQLRNIYEHISMYTKTDEYTYNADDIRITDTEEFGRWWVDYPERYHPKGKLPDNVWEFPIPKQGEWGPKLNFHPSPFPEGLVERIIRLATDPGDIVLDPFAGVGSTLAVAEQLGRKPIGFELNSEYITYYHDHVRPRARRTRTEQQTLGTNKSRNSMEYIIWTLRIHKYAFRLQRELITNEDIKIDRKDISTVFALTDKSSIDTDSPPKTDICFVGPDELTSSEDAFESAVEGLISENRGSGDYYEVEFDLHAYSTNSWLDQTGDQDQGLPLNEEMYLYTNGVHYWYQTEITLEEWRELKTNHSWKRYQSPHWAPLISNLPIQVDNPQEDVEHSDTEDQAILASYFDGSRESED